MQSFLPYLKTLNRISPQVRIRRTVLPLLLSSSMWGGTILLGNEAAQAAPTRRDWCGTVWSVENQNTLAWINPATGLTTTASGPTTQITMPGGTMGTATAAIGIHKESGTMYAFDRTGATGTLYKYQFGVNTTWQAVAVSGLIGLTGTQTIAGASNNLNKMTVDSNTLLIAESNGKAVYSIPLNSAGAVTAGATVNTYTYSGDPGAYLHASAVNDPILYPVGTEFINGGDITTDEYGDTYNITYNIVVTGYPVVGGVRQQQTQTTKAYFYKKSGNTWVYQGETSATANFAGAAFYRGDLYVKAALQLKKVDLTRSGSGYTGWNNALSNIGAANGIGLGSADLAACSTPVISLTKTRQIYSDALLTTLVTDQTKVTTGQYIKYTVTAQNVGDAWARSTQIIDNLPIGTVYQPNSATLNGSNLGLATYPSSFTVNSPSISAGIVRYSTDPDTATLSFAVQVTATSGSISNQATTSYVDNEGLPSDPSVCTTIPKVNCANDAPAVTVVPAFSVNGTVWNDVDGSITINGSETGTNAGSSNLTIYAVNSTGVVVGKAPVSSTDGTYSIPGLLVGNYTLRLSNDANVAVGSSAPDASLPSNWVNTGENKNGVTETTTPGEIAVTVATTNIINQNFGIEQLPNTTDLNPAAQTNPGGTATVQVPTLAGTDPEDGVLGSAKSFKIVTLPTNGTLTYNNVLVITGQVITSYDPTLLKLDPNDGAVTVSFTYAAVDAAGKEDTTPATVTIPFTAASLLPTQMCGTRNITAMTFQNPVLESGSSLSVGAVYRFPSTTTGVDALVTINSFNNGASLKNIDLIGTGLDVNFQPQISAPNGGDSSVDFTIQFVTTGTTTPITIPQLDTSSLDVDGAPNNREYVQQMGFESYVVENPTVLLATINGSTGRFENTDYVTKPGVDITATENIVTTKYSNVTTFLYRAGVIKDVASSDDGRMSSLDFNCVKFNNVNPVSVVTIAGQVWDDADNSANNTFTNINTGTETGTNAGSLNAILVDASGNVIATTLVNADGTYSFSNITASQTNVSIRLSTTAGTVGSAAPTSDIPVNWTNTSPLAQTSFNIGTSNIPGKDFGVEQLPNTNGVTAASQNNPGGTNTVQVSALSGTDPEDGSLGTGKSFKIVTLPTNGALSYNGTAVIVGQLIDNYDPTKLTIDPNDGAITVSFTYAAVDAAGKEDPTPATTTMPFTGSTVVSNAKVLLVKRITAINGTPINKYVDDTTSAKKDDDSHPNWPAPLNSNSNFGDTTISTYLRGLIDGGTVRPGDEVEYTIYFLATGNSAATNVNFCDLVPANVTFIPTTFTKQTPGDGGIAGADAGIQLTIGNTTSYLTNVADSDRGEYFAPGTTPSVKCTAANSNGAVVVKVVNSQALAPNDELPNATAPGTPTGSYGFIRFRGRVK
jgi:uncharacterized repeat protein (TIGR01451 family)